MTAMERMMQQNQWNGNGFIRAAAAMILLAAALGGFSCAGKKSQGRILTDQRLYELGEEAMDKEKYTKARDYYTELTAIYPESEFYYRAKLKLADSYFLVGRRSEFYEGIALYESFVSYYPQNDLVCYARYQIANSYFELMEKPDRDQKATRKALAEFMRVINLCPDTDYAARAKEQMKDCNSNMAGHEYAVGFFYFRSRGYNAAAQRFKRILRDRQYEDFHDMPAVYYYLAESLRRDGKWEESRIYFQQQLEKYPDGEYSAKARRRLADIDDMVEMAEIQDG
jgi:outer membrane protein assembly factor BamD